MTATLARRRSPIPLLCKCGHFLALVYCDARRCRELLCLHCAKSVGPNVHRCAKHAKGRSA